MRNNIRELEECSKREIHRGEDRREKENTERENACMSFHRELRTEALLFWQPQGADITPGRGKGKGMTGSGRAQGDQGDIRQKEAWGACARPDGVF